MILKIYLKKVYRFAKYGYGEGWVDVSPIRSGSEESSRNEKASRSFFSS